MSGSSKGPVEVTPEKMERLVSLDAFRGFTVAAMIVVNTPGSEEYVYAPLAHASWNGVTPTDYIFPFFIFIVGISIALSCSRSLSYSISRTKLLQKALKRGLILFMLGVFLGLIPVFDFTSIRFPGVLQRIALVYVACVFVFVYTTWKQQVWIGALLLLLYWALMSWIPVPGIGSGVMEPGRNAAAWIDSLVIPGKMWQGSWDPEGILSTLPALVTGVSGMLIGEIILAKGMTRERKISWIFSAGLVSFGIGTSWGWVFPLNKNLWTSSYVLYTSGLAAMLFALFYFIMDELGYVRWAKIGVVFGLNAIAAYVIGSVLPSLLPHLKAWYQQAFMEDARLAPLISLLWALGVCALVYGLVYILYKRRIVIKI